MSRWLLDTNVISETRRPRPSPAVQSWIESLDIEQVCTASIVIAELRYGTLTSRDELQRLEISIWIDQLIRPWFGDRIYPVDESALLNWVVDARRLQQAREPAPPVDLLIAAVAKTSALGVATRDVKPFVSTGVPVLNPWTGERFNGA